jgi:putative RecB family exonuclease
MSTCGDFVTGTSANAAVAAGSAARSEEGQMEYLRNTVSASRLSCWTSCRLKFYFRYIQKLTKPPSPALHIGSVVHGVLQQWNLARWRGETRDSTEWRLEFDRQWNDLQLDTVIAWKDPEPKEQESAWTALEHYLSATPIPADERPEAVEVRAEADLSQHGLPTLIGFIDLIRPAGRIVDFKNTGKTPNNAQVIQQHELQLTAYGVLYRDATGNPESGFELHHLVRTKTPKVVITEASATTVIQRSRLFRIIESYVDGLEREDFVPSPGFMCGACDYLTECRGWSP